MWRAAVVVLLLAVSARADCLPGFSLYGHTAASDRILEVDISPKGRARVVATFLGEGHAGDTFTLDRRVLGFRPGEITRAVVFLKGDHPRFDEAGVVWITAKEARYLPERAWEMIWLGDIPRPDEFRKAVRTAVADRKAIARIGRMQPGADRAAAVSRVLEQRPEVAWYRFSGFGFIPPHPWDQPAMPLIGNYLTELRLALAGALGDLTPAEAAALLRRLEHLEPGDVRREHIELVAGAKVAGVYERLRSCYATAADREEKVAAARALLRADRKRATKLLAGDATADEPKLARRLLDVLVERTAPTRPTAGKPTAAALDLAARLARELLDGKRRERNTGNLVSRIGEVLRAGRRLADLPLLLALARSPRGDAAQALVHLREWTGNTWAAADPRWDDYIRQR